MKLRDELLVFSDLHAHNFKYGARRVVSGDPRFEGLYNSRLVDTINVLREIHQYALEHKIETILFGGDLFHRRSVQYTDVYNLTVCTLLDMVDDDIEIIMIPGNHDYADRQGLTHALQSIHHDKISVANGVDYFVTPGYTKVYTVPYTDDLEKAKTALRQAGELAFEHNSPKILLAHLGMQGARVGSDYVLISDQDVSVSDVPHEEFDLCLFGHFHEHQRLFGNGWFIGSTHEHNWGDSGGKRGFLHVKVYDEGVTFERIETNAPRFLVRKDTDTLMSDMRLKEVRSCDFMRVHLTKDLPFVKELWPESATLELIQAVDNSETRLTLQPDQLDPESALRAWAKEHQPEDLDESELVNKGVEILRKVKGG